MVGLSSISELASRISFKRNSLRWMLIAMIVVTNCNVSLAGGSKAPSKEQAAVTQAYKRAFYEHMTGVPFYTPYSPSDRCESKSENKAVWKKLTHIQHNKHKLSREAILRMLGAKPYCTPFSMEINAATLKDKTRFFDRLYWKTPIEGNEIIAALEKLNNPEYWKKLYLSKADLKIMFANTRYTHRADKSENFENWVLMNPKIDEIKPIIKYEAEDLYTIDVGTLLTKTLH
jgi:hypothetical protein